MLDGRRLVTGDETEVLVIGADAKLGVLVAADEFTTEREEVLETRGRSGLRTLSDSKVGGLSALRAFTTEVSELGLLRLKLTLTRLVAPRELANGRASSGHLPLFGGRESTADPGAEGFGLRGREAGHGSIVRAVDIIGAAGELIGLGTEALVFGRGLASARLDTCTVLGYGRRELLHREGGESVRLTKGTSSKSCSQLTPLDLNHLRFRSRSYERRGF